MYWSLQCKKMLILSCIGYTRAEFQFCQNLSLFSADICLTFFPEIQVDIATLAEIWQLFFFVVKFLDLWKMVLLVFVKFQLLRDFWIFFLCIFGTNSEWELAKNQPKSDKLSRSLNSDSLVATALLFKRKKYAEVPKIRIKGEVRLLND